MVCQIVPSYPSYSTCGDEIISSYPNEEDSGHGLVIRFLVGCHVVTPFVVDDPLFD